MHSKFTTETLQLQRLSSRGCSQRVKRIIFYFHFNLFILEKDYVYYRKIPHSFTDGVAPFAVMINALLKLRKHVAGNIQCGRVSVFEA